MSTALNIKKIVCPGCYEVLDVGDNFCRRCGVPTDGSAGPPAAPAQAAPGRSAGRPGWSENPWVVLATLFLVLGPLGLPMLWRSRQFSPTWKTVITIALLGITVAILWMIWFIVHQASAQLQDLL